LEICLLNRHGQLGKTLLFLGNTEIVVVCQYPLICAQPGHSLNLGHQTAMVITVEEQCLLNGTKSGAIILLQ